MSVLKNNGTNKNSGLSGLLLTGYNSVTEILLWALIMLPSSIVINGAGPCFTDIGIFAGTTFAWLLLVKKIRAYKDVSGDNINNMWDFMYSRYQSAAIKNISLFVWFIIIAMILVGLLIFAGDVIYCMTGLDKKLVIPLIVIVLDLVVLFVSDRAQSILMSIVYAFMLLFFISMIIAIFSLNTTSELLDTYGKARLSGGTSIYLNILYYNGENISVPNIISMIGKGLGCLGLPFLFKGAFEAKNTHELDRGRVWSMMYAGIMIVTISVWALLIVACIYPLEVSEFTRTDELLNIFLISFESKYNVLHFVRYAVLILFVLVILSLLTSFYSVLCEISGSFAFGKKNTKLLKNTNLSAIIGTAVISVLVILSALFLKTDYQMLIKIVWEYCSALAALYVMASIWKGTSKAGVLGGFIWTIAACTFWMFVPVVDGSTLMKATDLSAGVAAFVSGLAFIFIISIFTHKTSEREDKIFDQMRLEQR